ncbi:hypothetical protein VTO42DRAFT_4140 [Malbranchea cinnamomea]
MMTVMAAVFVAVPMMTVMAAVFVAVPMMTVMAAVFVAVPMVPATMWMTAMDIVPMVCHGGTQLFSRPSSVAMQIAVPGQIVPPGPSIIATVVAVVSVAVMLAPQALAEVLYRLADCVPQGVVDTTASNLLGPLPPLVSGSILEVLSTAVMPLTVPDGARNDGRGGEGEKGEKKRNLHVGR